MDTVRRAIQDMNTVELGRVQQMVEEAWDTAQKEANLQEGREGMTEWLEEMQQRARSQGSTVAARWWRERVKEWEEADRERRDKMLDHCGTGNWGEGVRVEWRQFQRQCRRDYFARGPPIVMGPRRVRIERRAEWANSVKIWELELESESDFN